MIEGNRVQASDEEKKRLDHLVTTWETMKYDTDNSWFTKNDANGGNCTSYDEWWKEWAEKMLQRTLLELMQVMTGWQKRLQRTPIISYDDILCFKMRKGHKQWFQKTTNGSITEVNNTSIAKRPISANDDVKQSEIEQL